MRIAVRISWKCPHERKAISSAMLVCVEQHPSSSHILHVTVGLRRYAQLVNKTAPAFRVDVLT